MAAGKKATVLYVDDEEVNVSAFELSFNDSYHILTATSADEGLKLLEDQDINVVIADYRMPIVTGVDLFERMASMYPDVSRIIMTGYKDPDGILEAINRGKVFNYLTKPWKEQDLKINIDNAVKANRLMKANRRLLKSLKGANLELAYSEEKFSRTFFSAPVALCITHYEDGKYVDVNKSYELLMGYRRDELIGKSPLDIGFWRDPAERVEFQHLIETHGRIFNYGRQVITKDHKTRYTKMSAELIELEGRVHILSMYIDITNEKMAQEKIISTIIETEDNERKRLAKELHDSLGQSLTTVSLNLAAINQEALDPENRQKMENAISQLRLAINESREIAHNLMPQAIQDYGYVIMVENMLDSLKLASNINFEFYNNLMEERLRANLELSLYRITQEAINNIIKHAQATAVTVQLTKYPDVIILSIEDNGKGYDPDKIHHSFGLHSMMNRTLALGGEFNIDTSPGRGTSIIIQTPLESEIYERN